MVDKVRPLKYERGPDGTENNRRFPTETDPSEDYVASKGIAFENADNRKIDLNGSGDIQITDATHTNKSFREVVRETVLLGINFAAAATITATDTVLSALGKIQATISAHIGSSGSSHAAVTQSVNGFMTATDKVKLDNAVARVSLILIGTAGVQTSGTAYLAAGNKVLWVQSRNAQYKNGIILFSAAITTRNMDVRVVNATNADILSSVLTVSASGNYTLSFSVPTADAIIEVQIRQATTGSGPTISNVMMEFDTI